ncbi:MAG: carbohydrate-binding domain-containing protein [Clostridia bacterium]|nr:carbohydrate-binding domain-containing protein [Clostridia bacterium]
MTLRSKKITAIIALLLVMSVLFVTLTACGGTTPFGDNSGENNTSSDDGTSASSDKDEDYEFVEDLKTALVVTCVEGTADAYTLTDNGDGTGTLAFSTITENTTYSVSGTLNGNIVIDVDETETFDFDLELTGLTMQSENEAPIVILSGDNVSIVAKKDTENYIYDKRAEISDDDETQYSSAIYSVVDLDVQGKGYLWICSDNNNGVHTKDDLTVKNLTLYVKCKDNALKGNDSVTVEGTATLTLIATAGDGIKTKNNDVSSKGKQRGIVTLSGGTIEIYAACDGIDAAYDVVIDSQDVSLTVYTDKYSAYSEEVTAVSDGTYYIRATTTSYKYSILYTNSSSGATKWVNSSSYTTSTSGGMGPRGGGSTYYFYSMDKPSGYDQMQIYVYTSSQSQGQSETYSVTVNASVNDSYDTIAYNGSSFSWTNKTTQSGRGGFGGMNDGNTDKGDYSTKGIKADNSILISDGTVTVKSYDDALHAAASIEISGGTVTLYSNDDGVHSDATLTITGGTISVTNSYEGLEAGVITIDGGIISVVAKDDGINGTNTSGTDLYIKSGYLYVYAGGDGLDTNSTTSYAGISFEGGTTVVISTSGGNSCIDTERGYKYSGGKVLAMCPTGMTSECEMCANFSSVAVKKTSGISSGSYVSVGEEVAVKMPTSINSGYIVYLSGSSSKTISVSTSGNYTLNNNGVYWAE